MYTGHHHVLQCPCMPGCRALQLPSALQDYLAVVQQWGLTKVTSPGTSDEDRKDDEDDNDGTGVGSMAGSQQQCRNGAGGAVVRRLADLEDGGYYALEPTTKEALQRVVGELRHLQQRREEEMGTATLAVVQEQEPQQASAPRRHVLVAWHAQSVAVLLFCMHAVAA